MGGVPGLDGVSVLSVVCECGCLMRVELTVADYDALGGEPVYRDGHDPGGSGSASA